MDTQKQGMLVASSLLAGFGLGNKRRPAWRLALLPRLHQQRPAVKARQ